MQFNATLPITENGSRCTCVVSIIKILPSHFNKCLLVEELKTTAPKHCFPNDLNLLYLEMKCDSFEQCIWYQCWDKNHFYPRNVHRGRLNDRVPGQMIYCAVPRRMNQRKLRVNVNAPRISHLPTVCHCLSTLASGMSQARLRCNFHIFCQGQNPVIVKHQMICAKP